MRIVSRVLVIVVGAKIQSMQPTRVTTHARSRRRTSSHYALVSVASRARAAAAAAATEKPTLSTEKPTLAATSAERQKTAPCSRRLHDPVGKMLGCG